MEYSDWLKKRIKETQEERDNSTDIKLVMTKGAKITAYKECLNYVTTHQIESELIDCIQNLIGFIDTPIAKNKLKGEFVDEARKIGNELLIKFGRKIGSD